MPEETSEQRVRFQDGVPVFETKLEQIEREQAEARDRDKRYRDEQLIINRNQLSVNRWMMIFTALLFLASVVTGVIAIYQYSVGKNSADAARDGVHTAEDSLEMSIGAFDRTMAQTIHQTSAQLKSAQAAKDAVEQARSQLRMDQRAWLVATTITMGDLEDGKPLDFGFVGTNSGRTPARKVIIHTYVTVSAKELLSEADLVTKISQARQPASVGLVAPNATFTPGSDPVPVEVIPLMKAKLGTSGCSYSWGDIEYEDIFKERHTSEYCSYRCLNSADKQLIWCKFHNEAD